MFLNFKAATLRKYLSGRFPIWCVRQHTSAQPNPSEPRPYRVILELLCNLHKRDTITWAPQIAKRGETKVADSEYGLTFECPPLGFPEPFETYSTNWVKVGLKAQSWFWGD